MSNGTSNGSHVALSATAGVPFDLRVAASDDYGNVATSYAGTIHFSSSDLQAGLPADYTFVTGDDGTHTFPTADLATLGTQSISVADTAQNSVRGSEANITVTAGTADHLVIGTVNATVTMKF